MANRISSLDLFILHLVCEKLIRSGELREPLSQTRGSLCPVLGQQVVYARTYTKQARMSHGSAFHPNSILLGKRMPEVI